MGRASAAKVADDERLFIWLEAMMETGLAVGTWFAALIVLLFAWFATWPVED